MSKDFETLKSLSRFKLCSHEDLLVLKAHGNFKTLLRGNFLFYEGQQPEGLTVIVNGYVKVTRTLNGKSNLLKIFGPGQAVGEVATSLSCSYPATAECIVDIEVFVLPITTYAHLKKLSPTFLETVAQQTCKMALALGDKPLDYIDGEAEERIMHFLKGLFDKHGSKITPDQSQIPFSLSRAEIAAAIDARPETVSRILAKLEASGDFQTSKSHMIGRDSFFREKPSNKK